MMHSRTTLSRLLALVCALGLLAAACGEDTDVTSTSESATTETPTTTAPEPGCFTDPGLDAVAAPDGTFDTDTIRLATHGSFALSTETLETFTAETGITVEVVAGSDAGALVAEAVLTKDNPTADVLFGIDNAFLCRGLEAGLFAPYASGGLADVDDSLELDPHHRVTPISYGDVCINYWTDALPGDAPGSLEDLTKPEFAGQFVTENPETSSPGFAFLLATIAEFGEDGWEDYWQALVDNDISVTAGWEEAYYGEFTAGGGSRALVTSYASSPPAEFMFADPPVDAPPTGSLDESCFRQIEFAGILQGSPNAEAAAALIDFMLSETYQADIPENMFVYPANDSVALPEAFAKFGKLTDNPITMDPEEIEANRDDWTARWTEIVLG